MKKFILSLLLIGLILAGCTNGATSVDYAEPDKDEILSVATQVAEMFYFNPKISPNVKNLYVGSNEIGSECAGYALAFYNIWNEKYPAQALLALQGTTESTWISNGLYKITGKADQDLPKLKLDGDRYSFTYNLYEGSKIVFGVYHHELGCYRIQLVEKQNYKTHNGKPIDDHMWVRIGDVSVDPTWFDTGGINSLIGVDTW